VADAKEKLSDPFQNFDLIMMDVWMPGQDGMSLLEEWMQADFSMGKNLDLASQINPYITEKDRIIFLWHQPLLCPLRKYCKVFSN
jgi:CheY-like chemotaxis protein